jgi:hypothetical protein
MNKLKALQIIQGVGKSVFSFRDLKKLFRTSSDNTAYQQMSRLVREGVLRRAGKGIYFLGSDKPSDFELANYLHGPSYISLESALSYYGILIQSPRQVISVTPQRSKTIKTLGREFVYLHLDRRYYIGYQKERHFLIASPEKALLDALFFCALGRMTLSLEELVLDSIEISQLEILAGPIKNKAFQKYFSSAVTNIRRQAKGKKK